MLRRPSLLLAALVLAYPLTAGAVPDQVVIYNGYLEQNGVAVNGTATVNYDIYNQATDGIQCGDRQTIETAVHLGHFSNLVNIPAVCFVGREVYLEISIGGGVPPTTFGKRQRVYPAILAAAGAGGELSFGSGSALTADQGGSIELGDSTRSGTTPFIDFHVGVGGARDFDVRLINSTSGWLTLLGSFSATSLYATSATITGALNAGSLSTGTLNASGAASVASLTVSGAASVSGGTLTVDRVVARNQSCYYAANNCVTNSPDFAAACKADYYMASIRTWANGQCNAVMCCPLGHNGATVP